MRNFNKTSTRFLKQRRSHLGYEISYTLGEKTGCSSQIIIADRIFYVKHFNVGSSRFFSGDQQGIIQKEISKAEFELWLGILADSDADVAEIHERLALGKKF